MLDKFESPEANLDGVAAPRSAKLPEFDMQSVLDGLDLENLEGVE
ncbi:MAG: hypothetical protein O3A80_04980 [bacterium]|nr:hypothetical protein [bacterium]